MKQSTTLKLSLLLVLQLLFLQAQEQTKSALLDIDRIYSGEFEEETERTIQWIEGGDAYVIIEKSQSLPGADELIRYDSRTQAKSIFVNAGREFFFVKRRHKGADIYKFQQGMEDQHERGLLGI